MNAPQKATCIVVNDAGRPPIDNSTARSPYTFVTDQAKRLATN